MEGRLEGEIRQMGFRVFLHIVPSECGCIVAFVKVVSIASTNGIKQASLCMHLFAPFTL